MRMTWQFSIKPDHYSCMHGDRCALFIRVSLDSRSFGNIFEYLSMLRGKLRIEIFLIARKQPESEIARNTRHHSRRNVCTFYSHVRVHVQIYGVSIKSLDMYD